MAVYNGSGVVWDPVKGKPLCNLNNGPYATTDKREQALMLKARIKGDFEDEMVIIEDDEVVEEVEEVEDEVVEDEDAIRAKAKELGIKSSHNKKLDTLKKEIKEKEGVVNE